MNSDFLNNYHIPLRTNDNAEQSDTGPSREMKGADGTAELEFCHQNPGRFIAPGKYSTSMEVAQVAAPIRGTKRKQEELTGDHKLPIFQGRDESYPDELNKLIQPLSCQLCKVNLTSIKSAKDHYESKSHDRHISAWLAKNYTDIGLQCPPIKRMIREGSSGPNAYHCELCDLALTSLTHARQHYSGRKHKLVDQKLSKPSGSGYFDPDGKWVRTGTKIEPHLPDDGRFGIGEKFVVPVENKPNVVELPLVMPVKQDDVVDDSLCCKLCKISVTSATQMQMHLDGIKHRKKLRASEGVSATPISTETAAEATDEVSHVSSTEDPKLDAGLAMYRTPSGSFYCKLCNKVMNHVSILQQHLLGKRHLKIERQQTDK